MAFTYTWNAITAGQFDADSPWNTIVTTSVFQNLTNLREWIGKSYYAGAAEDHDHDGTNSAEPVIPTNAIGKTEMAANSVGGSELYYTAVSNTSQAISVSATFTFTTAQLIGSMIGGGLSSAEVYVNSVWGALPATSPLLTLYNSGSRLRVTDSGSGSTVYWYYLND